MKKPGDSGQKKLGRPSKLGKAVIFQFHAPILLETETIVVLALFNNFASPPRSAPLERADLLRKALAAGLRALLWTEMGVEAATLDFYAADPSVQAAVALGNTADMVSLLQGVVGQPEDVQPPEVALEAARHTDIADFKFACCRPALEGEVSHGMTIFMAYKDFVTGRGRDFFAMDDFLYKLDRLCKSTYGAGIKKDEHYRLSGIALKEA